MLTHANLTRWIRDQQKSEGVSLGEDVYIILRLDGRVRRSGKVSSISEQRCFSFLLIVVELSHISFLDVIKNYEHHFECLLYVITCLQSLKIILKLLYFEFILHPSCQQLGHFSLD